MNAEAQNIRINISSYCVDINEVSMEWFRREYELINSMLPKDVSSISSSNDSGKPNTLIVTSHSKQFTQYEIKNLINSLFEHFGN